jgi:protein TonB
VFVAGIGEVPSGPGGGGGDGLGGGSAGGRTGGPGHAAAGRGDGGGSRLASRGGGAGAHGVAGVLAVIRRRIEEARIYPDAARQSGTQGTVELRFRIGPDGSVAELEILRSSGSPTLDAAGADAIRRAAPYPVVSGWIRLPLAFRLAGVP